MSSSQESDTRERLLDAAEKLFSAHGIGATSLRAITVEAGANLASIHYHFGSKDELLLEVFSRRITPVNSRRMELLEIATANGPGELDAIARAFVSPALHILRSPGGRSITQLMGRLYSEPLEIKFKLLKTFEPIVLHFTEAIGLTLPHLSQSEVFWRFHYMVGSMAFTMVSSDIVESRLEGSVEEDVDEGIERLVRFISGGLSAPGKPDQQTRQEEGNCEK